MSVSLLSKFKPSSYFLAIEDEWFEFSYDSEELKLLEQIVTETESGEIGINLLKRNGIHPSEDEAIKEQHQAYLDASKLYFNLITDVANKTGLTRTEVQLRLPQDIDELEEEIRAAADKAKNSSSNYLEIRQELQRIKQTSKEESIKIAQILQPYAEQFTQATADYNKAFDDYYVYLIALFLSGKRLTDKKKITFTPQNFRNLHPGLRSALAGFVTQEITGWEKDNEKGKK
jgi:hypothetical protein